MKKKEDLISVKIRRTDYKKLKRLAVTREMKFYQLITSLLKTNK
jgi:hypothetical protein